jgi:Uma2 family endonuclease
MGIRELWLIDNETKEIEVRSFEANTNAVYKINDVIKSRVLPKIRIPVAALFS